MATVTSYTAARMKQIEDETIVDGGVSGDDLILVTREGTPINAGNVRGPVGPVGPPGGNVVGGIIMYAGVGNEIITDDGLPYDPPNNEAVGIWLVCNQAEYSTTEIPELFEKIGYTYGGSGGMFAVPPMMQRFPYGNANPDGTVGGEETHVLTEAEMPSHDHRQRMPTYHQNISGSNPGSVFGSTGSWTSASSRYGTGGSGVSGWNDGVADLRTRFAGGGDPHNNMPPYIVMNFLIYGGLYLPQP